MISLACGVDIHPETTRASLVENNDVQRMIEARAHKASIVAYENSLGQGPDLALETAIGVIEKVTHRLEGEIVEAVVDCARRRAEREADRLEADRLPDVGLLTLLFDELRSDLEDCERVEFHLEPRAPHRAADCIDCRNTRGCQSCPELAN